MKPLTIDSGSNGHSSFSIPVSTDINGAALGIATAESITIPSGAKFAVFSATGDFYAKYNGTAVVITDVTDGTGSELNPTVRSLLPADTISIISPAACNVTVSFYS